MISEQVHTIVVSNSLAWERQELVTLRVGSRNVEVLDDESVPVPSQIDPFWDAPNFAEASQAEFVLHFVATIPPMGVATFFLRFGEEAQPACTK